MVFIKFLENTSLVDEFVTYTLQYIFSVFGTTIVCDSVERANMMIIIIIIWLKITPLDSVGIVLIGWIELMLMS